MNVQKKLVLGLIKARLNLLSVFNAAKAGREIFKLFCTPFTRYKGKPSQVFTNAEQLNFLLDEKIIHGFRINHPAQKKALLLHGFLSSLHKFDHFVQPLINIDYEVLAFDAPAHGSSEGINVNAMDYAAMIKKIDELYGPIDSYISHSFGGIAVCLALEEMPHPAAAKVVLIAPATETHTAIDNAFAMLNLKNEKLRKAIDDEILRVSGKETSWYSVRRAIKNIRASVLWIHDTNDFITPITDVIKVQEDNNPHVKFIITNGLGHQKIYRDAKVLDSVTSFLS